MADVLIRLATIRGTLAAFAVDLFAGRVGSLTDAPMCSGGYDRWGVYDGSAWRLGVASDYAGNAQVLSLKVNGVALIDSTQNVKANEIWTGGAIRINALGDGTFRNLAASALTIGTYPIASSAGGLLGNGALTQDAAYVRSSKPMSIDSTVLRIAPAAGQATLGMDVATGNAAVNVAYTAGSARWLWGKSNDAESGANAGSAWFLRAFGDAGTPIDSPIQITRVAGGQFVIARPLKTTAGLGVHGVTPPATRPTISGQRTATATLAALYAALSATGLILDSTTGTSVTREAIIQPLPITNAAPSTVTVAGGVKSFGFDGGASTEELFYHCDIQHDYIAGGDMVFHVHWMPDTGTGGNVKWQIEYMWVEAGGTWNAASSLFATVAAGTVAKADMRADLTLPGTGHTYNSRIMIRLFRNPADAADTYAGDAILSSVGIHYQADPGQP